MTSNKNYSTRMQELGATRLLELMAQRTNTNAQDWYLVFKARQAMKVVFDALAEAEIVGGGKGEVITQLYTCCTAVNPIVSAGLTPVYADISPDTFAVDAAKLPLGEDSAAIMLQHTFGVIDAQCDAELCERAHAAGALVLEDCAHCAGRMSLDADGTPQADISFHSFGVEKMLPTHFGGAVWINPELAPALRSRIVTKLEELPELDTARATAAQHYLNQIRLITRLPHGAAHTLRSRLEARGKFEPAVAQTELTGNMAGESALPSAWVVERVTSALEAASTNEELRKEAVALYNQELLELCVHTWDAEQPLHKYAYFAADAQQANNIVSALNEAGIYTVSWYRPLLFPGVTDEAAYGLKDGMKAALKSLPQTKDCSERVVCLPTDIPASKVAQVAEILKNISAS